MIVMHQEKGYNKEMYIDLGIIEEAIAVIAFSGSGKTS